MTARLAYASRSTLAPDLPCQQIWLSDADARAFGPRQHVTALHPGNGRPGPLAGQRAGTVSFGQKVRDFEKPWKEWAVDVGEAAWRAEDLIRKGEAEDLYFSQNCFRGWRRIAYLKTLGACYVDLDFRTRVTHADKPPRWVAEGILVALDDEGLPLPSYIMHTGRGLCAVWLTELLPRAALPRWQAVQKRLAEVLTSFGADKRALDAARIFRVAGSINSRADPLDACVRLLWCRGDPTSPFRHVFDDLANEALPFTRAELVSLAAERSKRRAEREQRREDRLAARQATASAAGRLTIGTWAETLLTDLQRLRAHRYPNGAIRSGERDAWLFCAATAMAWLAPPEVLKREISALASEAAGWRASETRSRMSSVFGRAVEAAAGRKLTWKGNETDPRYRMKAATVIDWLEIDPGEMRAAGLRMLVDRGRRRELATERERESRRRKGAKDRGQMQAERLELGRNCLYMRSKDGMTRDELAAHFGVSAGQISKAMADAREPS